MTLTPPLAFFHLPSNPPSPSVSSRFHSIPVQRISVKQAQPSPPASISTVLCFPGVLFWVPFLGILDTPPPHPMFYLADADLFVIRAKINKNINPGPRRLLYTLLIFLPRSSRPLSPALEFFFFDKRNSGGFLQILESGWSSCIFWERLSRASCKEDVAEERCFLTDKGKASLRQDVWAWLGPALKSQREGREPAVLRAGGNTAVLISISLLRLYLTGIFQDILSQPGQVVPQTTGQVDRSVHTAEGASL